MESLIGSIPHDDFLTLQWYILDEAHQMVRVAEQSRQGKRRRPEDRMRVADPW